MDEEWTLFAGEQQRIGGGKGKGRSLAGSQMQEMDPLASPFSSFAPPGGSTSGGGSGSDPAAEDALSPYWNPELETLSYLRSSHSPHSTPSLSTSTTPSYSDLSPDDAYAISCAPTPPVPAPTSHDPPTPSAGTAHPLTLNPPSHAAWDFDKLFSNRRRWYGGVRIPGLAQSFSSFEEEGSKDGTSEGQEREAQVFEALRKVALERLGAVGAHLSWSK
jgi:hypothetical protein